MVTPSHGTENEFFPFRIPVGQLGDAAPLFWGTLNSFLRLFSLHQAMGRQKIRLSGSRPKGFPFICPPHHPHRTKNGFLHLLSPVGQFGYGTPLFFGGAEFIYAAISHHEKHWGVRKCGFLGPDRQNFCLCAFTPSHGTENGFFHFHGLVGQFW